MLKCLVFEELCLPPRAFTTLCYSADGQNILAGGMSKFVCLYHVREQILVKRFELSCNLSLDAMEVSRCIGSMGLEWAKGLVHVLRLWQSGKAILA